MKPAQPVMLLTIILLLTSLWLPLSFAAPNEMNFQGRLADVSGNPVPDGNHMMEFRILDGIGTQLWGETQDVLVMNGIYNVALGQGTQISGFGPLESALFSEDDRWLQVIVNSEELSPPQKITSVAYAFQAGSVANAAITRDMLADNAVTTDKIADESITSQDIQDGTGSGLDSDTLDGHDTAYFATAAHSHDGRYYTEEEVNQLLETYASRIAALEAKLERLTVSADGNQIFITGANLHVRSGSGETEGDVNGLGNVIIGYNEDRSLDNDKSGSHNLVVGPFHNYSRYGGIVVGYRNQITDTFSSVSGGAYNIASGAGASVSGGFANTASGASSHVSGGAYNIASGIESSISGGFDNDATDNYTSVSGGAYNIASEYYASISGGYNNTGSGNYSFVGGGRNNTASGDYSSVLGGGSENSVYGNVAWADYSSILGGIYNRTGDPENDPDHSVGIYSTISGGDTNQTTGRSSTVNGGLSNTAEGFRSTVSGGYGNDAQGENSTIGGGAGVVTTGLSDYRAGSCYFCEY